MIRLVHIADLVVTVGQAIEIGKTPAGVRRLIPITGGVARGPDLWGAVLPQGADFQLIRDNGATELHARYAIRTDDGALIYVENREIRRGAPDAMEKLRRGEAADPSLIYFRTTPRFETGAGPYRWFTEHLFLAESVRRPGCVELAVHRVD